MRNVYVLSCVGPICIAGLEQISGQNITLVEYGGLFLLCDCRGSFGLGKGGLNQHELKNVV